MDIIFEEPLVEIERKIESVAVEIGRVVANIDLINQYDLDNSEKGLLNPQLFRKASVSALVDTGSTLLSLPEEVIQKLGLNFFRDQVTKLANGQKAVRKIYGPVTIKVVGRTDSVLALAGYPGVAALLGQIPLEGLDLMVDSKRLRLVPGHPDMPDQQVVDMY